MESRAILDKLKSKGYPLPQVITNESLRAEAHRVYALESHAEQDRSTLSARSLEILAYMEYNGYPLPATISDQSLDAEYSRVWALEEYALN